MAGRPGFEPRPPIREEGGRYSIRGLCLRVGARVIWFGHRQGGGWNPIVQARPNMSPTEIDQARRQVREELTEAQDRPAPARAQMTVRELGAIYLQDLEAYTRRSPEPPHAGGIPGSLASAPRTTDRRS